MRGNPLRRIRDAFLVLIGRRFATKLIVTGDMGAIRGRSQPLERPRSIILDDMGDPVSSDEPMTPERRQKIKDWVAKTEKTP